MALVSMKALLMEAEKENYGVGAFSIANMEMIMGVIKAAEEKKSPAILQIAQVRLMYSPLSLIGPMMIAAAKNASVPIAVHFDHGFSYDYIKEALELGFTSVMMDASNQPINQNIEEVLKIKELADRYGAALEAEVGQLAGSEDGTVDQLMYYSDPFEVKKLYEQTGVDAIALSIGNTHGLYKKEPKLMFDILEQSRKLVPIPLVLHGGSGITEEGFKTCIHGGIRKINIATANFIAAEEGVRRYCQEEHKDYFTMSHTMMLSIYESVAKHMDIFGSSGKAGEYSWDT